MFIIRFLLAILRRLAAVARPTYRFGAYLFAIVAMIALVADLTPAFNGTGGFSPTPLASHWESVVPKSLVAAKKSVEGSMPSWVWTPLISTILSVPTFLLFGGFALLMGYAGRRRSYINVFAN